MYPKMVIICLHEDSKILLVCGGYKQYYPLLSEKGRDVFMKYDLINLKTVMNKNPDLGGLTFCEGENDIPFQIRRIYYIYQTKKNEHRGFHAHKTNWQLLCCPYGSIDIILTDGTEVETIRLDDPSKGLVLHPGLWREMIWQKDESVLFVAASEYYDPEEYIRDYKEYLKYIGKEK